MLEKDSPLMCAEQVGPTSGEILVRRLASDEAIKLRAPRIEVDRLCSKLFLAILREQALAEGSAENREGASVLAERQHVLRHGRWSLFSKQARFLEDDSLSCNITCNCF